MRQHPSFPELLAAAFVTLSALASPALAAWTPITLVNVQGSQYGPRSVTDGANGAIVVWFDDRSGTGAVYAQHVLASGAADPSWPTNGRLVGPASDPSHAVVSDGAGGAIVAWLQGPDSDVYAHHVLSSGALDPAWPSGGVVVCNAPNNQLGVEGVSDGAGGAIFTWNDLRSGARDVYAQRVLSGGTVSWTANGLGVCTAVNDQFNPVAVADGSGGVIIAWGDIRNGTDYDVYAQRLTSTGAVSAGWTANGVQLVSDPGDQLDPRISSDGAGGALVTWSDNRNGVDDDIYAMRIRSTGALGQGWHHNGEAICTAVASQEPFGMIPDGAGGAIISWSDPRAGDGFSDIYVQKLTGAGAVSWTANGVALCTAANYQVSPSLGADGAGGAYVAWQDRRFQTGANQTELFLHHVQSTGAPDPSWPANGGRVTFDGVVRFGGNYEQPVLATGSGNALVFWAGEANSGHEDLYDMAFNATWTPRYVLTVGVGPNQVAGVVARNPDAPAYVANSNVTLTATASTGYAFSNWSGDASGSTNPLSVTMTSDKNITANFIGYPVNVTISPPGSGTVTKSPTQATYAPGSQVILTANATSYPFLGWSGDASGPTNPLTITVDGVKNITASFQAYTVTTSVVPAGTGSVAASPNQALYAPGASVSLSATPVDGSAFSSWSGDLTGTVSPLSIVMDGNKNVTANFSVTPPACGGWSLVAAAPGPPGLTQSSAVWDPVRNRMLVFGGLKAPPPPLSVPIWTNDVWALSVGGGWTQLAPAGTLPTARGGAWACYDPVRDRMLIFGGSSACPSSSCSILQDLWALSLSGTPTWTQIVPAGSGPPGLRRSPRTIIYDPVRDRLLFFGGGIWQCSVCPPLLQNDTWQLSLTGVPTWTDLAIPGPLPPASTGDGAVYDPVRDRMLIYGSSVGTWALPLSGAPTWSNLSPVGTLPPSPGLANIYDPARDQVAVIGQTTYLLDFKYGPMWSLEYPTGTMSRANSGFPVVYDPDLGAALIYGGGSYANTAMRLDLTGGNTLVAGAANGSVLVDHDRWCLGSGEIATLVAAPANGYQFNQWLGDASGNSNPLQLTMDASKVVRAEFVVRTTGVEEPPLTFALGAIHPNPAVGRVSIDYSLAREARVQLGVYDISGRLVASLVDGVTAAGRKQATWDGTFGHQRAASGVYFARLVTPAGTWVKRLVLAR